MSRHQSSGPGSQPPQGPLDLWRTAPGRSSFPFAWILLVAALGVLFASGFWFRGGDVARKPPEAIVGRGVELKDLLPPIPPQDPREAELDALAGDVFRANEKFGVQIPKEVEEIIGPARAARTDPVTTQRLADAERRRRELEAKTAQRAALEVAARAKDAVGLWRAELDRWDALSAQLLDGEEGKPIAGDVEFIRQFRAALQGTERPGRQECDQVGKALDQLMAPIEGALHDPTDVLKPSGELAGTIEMHASRATSAAKAWKEAIQEMNALKLLARRKGLSGKTTLRRAIEDLETEMVAERLKEKNAKLAEAEKKAAETEASIAAAKVVESAEMKKAQAEDEQKARRQQAERLKKRQFARGEEVRRHLGSLMEKGFTQPEPWGNIATPKKTGEEQPVSLAALRTSGCLAPGLAGQARLANFMVHPDMDRTRWGMFPEKELWKPDQQRFIARAHQLLIEYGEALVDEGLLAK